MPLSFAKIAKFAKISTPKVCNFYDVIFISNIATHWFYAYILLFTFKTIIQDTKNITYDTKCDQRKCDCTVLFDIETGH